MQRSSASTASAAPFSPSPAVPSVPEDPGVTALRSALNRVVFDDTEDVLKDLLDCLGPAGKPVEGVTAGGRKVARVLNLEGVSVPYLAVFDKSVWRALADLAARRGFAMPPQAALPSGVEILGVPGRSYFRGHQDLVEGDDGLLKVIDSLRERQVASTERCLNLVAKFPESDSPIACRHLALDWIARRQAHLAGYPGGESKTMEGKSSSRFTNLKVSSQEELQKNVLPTTEGQFHRIAADREKSAAIVYLSQLSDFFKQEFSSLAPGQHRHFLLVSTNHAMAVELRCKERAASSPCYVLNFYDPNRTVTSRRMVFERPESVSLLAADLIPRERDLATYFGDIPKDRVGLFCRLADPSDPASLAQRKAALVVHRPASGLTSCAPREVWLRARYGLAQGMDAFMESQVLCDKGDPQANSVRLDGRAPEEEYSALMTAILSGNFDIARSMVEAAQAAFGDGRLTVHGLLDFLRPMTRDGKAAYSSVEKAMKADSVASLDLTPSLLRALVVAHQRGLSQEDVTDLLPNEGSRWTAWTTAVESGGSDAAITKNLWALVQASQTGLLTLDQLLPVDEIPGHFVILLERAEASGDFELARAVWAVCAQALLTGLLDDEGYDTLLQPKPGADGKFNQMGALMQAGAPADLLADPVWAVVHSRLEPQQKVDLLAKLYPRPEWFAVSRRGQEQSQAVWVDAVRKAGLDALAQAHRSALRERLGLEFDLTPITRPAADPVTTPPASG